MKRKIQMTAVFLALALALTGARAHAGFFDIFRPDLKFTLVVDRTEGLSAGDAVEFQDAAGRRETIGRIDAIPDAGGGEPVVAIRIKARHKDRVRAGSQVIIERPWFNDGPVRIAIVTPAERIDAAPLKSGAVLRAQTPAAAKAQQVVGSVQALMGSLIDRSRQYLDRLQAEIDGGRLDRFKDQLRDTTRELGRYSRAQKERFKKEVLPELERLMESARRRFQEMKDSDEAEEIEREFRHIKEELAV